MSKENLGKLKNVKLREFWRHEAYDFTNWLAEPENLQLLSDAIGNVDISLIEKEKHVGRFKVDILAEDADTENKIVIENQLEVTNHEHLGKIITYASGTEAKIIIWIVKEAKEEHRKAIDWLNEHTDDDVKIFLIQINLLQIDQSLLAPKFEIISKPNNWAKIVKQSTNINKLTDTKTKQFKFWEEFKEYINIHDSTLKITDPKPRHWVDSPIGYREAKICFRFLSRDKIVGTELYIVEKDLYYFLEDKKEEIEEEIRTELEWKELPDKTASRIILEADGPSIDAESYDEKYFEWLKETGENFKNVFSKCIEEYRKAQK